MSGIARFRTMVLDCPEPLALAEFYSRVLGWPVTAVADDWVVVSDGGSPKRLAFQLVRGYRPPVWPDGEPPQQYHLDFTVDDLDAAEAEVLKLGAVKHPHQPDPGESHRVFLDPAGHLFCLCVGDPV